MNDTIRPEREYTVHYRDDSERGSEQFTVPAGTEDAQDQAAWTKAEEQAEAWAAGGEWGDEGASITVRYYLEDADSDWSDAERSTTVDIAPDHDALVKAAGGDADCDHEWSSEGEGGCDENPGVWSTGGTSMVYRSHCTKCGLIRIEKHTGSQRNPGEHDSVRYEMPVTE